MLIDTYYSIASLLLHCTIRDSFKFSNINDLRLSVSKVLYEENDLSTSTDVIGENFKYAISSRFKSSGSSNFDTSSPFKIFETVHIYLNPIFFSKTVFIFSCTALPILFCALLIAFCTSNTILIDSDRRQPVF